MADDTARPSLLPSTSAPQPREVLIPDATSDTFAPFVGGITGDISAVANMMTVWTPIGTSFILRGGYVLAVCDVALAGALPVAFLSLYDGDNTHRFMPLGLYRPNATLAGEVICGEEITAATRPNAVPWRFDLGKGYRSLSPKNKILIGGGAAIGAGSIIVQGMLWGIQG